MSEYTYLSGKVFDADGLNADSLSPEEEWLEGWNVELVWKKIEGRMECVGLALVGDGTEPLTASLLRRLPLGSLILGRRKAEAKWFDVLRATHDVDSDPVLQAQARYVDALIAPRKRYTDDEYQLVADTYDEAMDAGIPPTAHVQEKLGLKTRTQAGKLVARVRARGLLPPTDQRIPKGNE
jgi:hypothetical protein